MNKSVRLSIYLWLYQFVRKKIKFYLIEVNGWLLIIFENFWNNVYKNTNEVDSFFKIGLNNLDENGKFFLLRKQSISVFLIADLDFLLWGKVQSRNSILWRPLCRKITGVGCLPPFMAIIEIKSLLDSEFHCLILLICFKIFIQSSKSLSFC